jgi:hypothetical protein
MALNLYDKLFHQPQLVRVFFPEMLFANVSSLFLPVLSPKTHRRFKVAGVNDCRDVYETKQRKLLMSFGIAIA